MSLKMLKSNIILNQIRVGNNTMEESIIFLICFSPIILGILGMILHEPVTSWIINRHERKLREQKHLHNIEMLKIKQQHELLLAEKTQDSIQMLALDPKFGEDFDRRLRIALSQNKESKIDTPSDSPLEVSEDDLLMEEVKNPPKIKRMKR